MRRITTNIFDTMAESYDNNPERLKRAEKTFQAMKEKIKFSKKMNCLEYGSGTGLLGFKIHPHVNRIILLDSSEKMIKVLKSKIKKSGVKNMQSLLGDLFAEKTIRKRFNLIYTLMTLHHIIDTKKIIKKFYDLLEPDGFLIIADLVKEDGSFHAHLKKFDGHNGFDVKLLKKTLKEVGFKDITSKIYYTLHKGLNGINREYPLFLMTGKK